MLLKGFHAHTTLRRLFSSKSKAQRGAQAVSKSMLSEKYDDSVPFLEREYSPSIVENKYMDKYDRYFHADVNKLIKDPNAK